LCNNCGLKLNFKIMFKNILLVIVCAFSFSVLIGQITPTAIAHPDTAKEEVSNEGGPIMHFDTKEVQYGVIKQHSEPLRTIAFTNTGDEPLIIKNCKGSCGCTVPIWPKEPILPGESGEIEIRYATNRLGKINKTVKITTNETTEPIVLKVLGEVLKAEEEESVPTTEPSMLNMGGGK
jgi:hypothetical protein